MNIILCEPDSPYREQITRLLWAWGEKYQHQDEIMLQSYQSSEDIFVAWEKGLQIDILLIAAEITDDLSGFEVAHRIQKINWYMPIVLVVDKETVRFDQYGFETLRFLFCPIKEDAFCSCMNICWLQAVENRKEIVFLRDRNQIIRIRASAITFIEHFQRHTEVHVADRKDPYVINSTLQRISRSLPADCFFRCHKSFIVNKQYISEIRNSEIIIAPGHIIPIGRTFHSTFMEQLLDHPCDDSESSR